MRKSYTFLITAALAGLGLAGCPSDEGDTDASIGMPTIDAGATTDACGLPEFAPGMVGEGKSLKVTLLAADHAPPAKYDNEWTVEVTDLDGNPVTDATAFEVEPYMVAHGHGATQDAVVTALDTPGQFMLSPVYMWMGGKWDVYFKGPGETRSQAATLYACILD